MKKVFSIILILAVILTAGIVPGGNVFAAPNVTSDGRYLTFDVEAPLGSIVKIEAVSYNGSGVGDTTGKNTGEFGPSEFSDKIESFFKVDPASYLEPGNYYYKITLKDKGVANVEYDDSEYIVWVYIEYSTDSQGRLLDVNGNVVSNASQAAKKTSIVLQKDNDYEKPTGVKFENTLTQTRTVKRIITYTELTADGRTVYSPVEETVVLERRVRCDSDGNPIDENGDIVAKDSNGEYDEDSLIYIAGGDDYSENDNPLGFDSSGRPYLTDDDGDPLTDSDGNIQYTTKWKIKSVTPASRAQTPATIDDNGNATVTTVLATPDHPNSAVWKPDKASVGAWVINLNNPPADGSVTKIPVIYYPRYAQADPGFQKIVDGIPKKAGKFTFVLKADDASYPMPDGASNGVLKVTVEGGGLYEFGTITYDAPGVYTYTMYEEAGKENGYTYDDTVYSVKVTVTSQNGNLSCVQEISSGGVAADSAIFVNRYIEPTNTGDLLNPVLWASVLAVAVIAIIVILLVRKKKNSDK